MPLILGCTISDSLLEQLMTLLVAESAPFFLTDDLRARMPPGSIIFKRGDLANLGLPLAFTDSYKLWAIKPEGTFFTLLSHDTFMTFPPDFQKALLEVQCQLGRGQIYQWSHVEPFIPVDYRADAQALRVTTPQGEYLVLDAHLWAMLPLAQRTAWLTDYLHTDELICQSGRLSELEWAQIESRCGSAIRMLAGQFEPFSGPNCFATTLAALLHDEVAAGTISALWIHQDVFFRELEQRGYRPAPTLNAEMTDLSDAVLIWLDGAGTAQHACYVIHNGLALNKNSQGWYSPRQLVRLNDLLALWHDETLHIAVYGR